MEWPGGPLWSPAVPLKNEDPNKHISALNTLPSQQKRSDPHPLLKLPYLKPGR